MDENLGEPMHPQETTPQGVFLPGQHGGHRPEDINFRALAIFLLVFIGAAIVLYLGLARLFLGFRDDAAARDVSPSPMAAQREAPPGPLLQADPPADLRDMLRRDAALLGQPGWIDREAGRVHIPIERAMELVAAGRSVAPATQPAERNSGSGARAPAKADTGE